MTITSSYSSRLEISRTSSGVRLSFLRPSSITLAAMEVTLLEAGHSLIAKDGDASITRPPSQLDRLLGISDHALFDEFQLEFDMGEIKLGIRAHLLYVSWRELRLLARLVPVSGVTHGAKEPVRRHIDDLGRHVTMPCVA